MATLQKIRDKGALLVIVIGVALLAFVLGDLFTSGSTFLGKVRDKAFLVNGEVISTQKYADKITEFEEFQKMVSGQTSLDENISSQIREAVYQQMVRERLLAHQTKKIRSHSYKKKRSTTWYTENLFHLYCSSCLFH